MGSFTRVERWDPSSAVYTKTFWALQYAPSTYEYHGKMAKSTILLILQDQGLVLLHELRLLECLDHSMHIFHAYSHASIGLLVLC